MSLTYPYPLAAASSHHSDYHRFLLGADAAALAPLPPPRCFGALALDFPELTDELTLARWRKLYRASFPWIPGFGPESYRVDHLAPHRPVPRAFSRPARRFAAFDFVQIADPSVSALALVGGDSRVAAAFFALNERFCREVERGTAAEARGPDGPACTPTGRCLAGLFAEPGNRWLMPFLHVHSRFLNFTSRPDDPLRLAPVDQAALGEAGRRARRGWTQAQAGFLANLGYAVEVAPGPQGAESLRVGGVPDRLLATLEVPRLGLLRLLERVLGRAAGAGGTGAGPGARGAVWTGAAAGARPGPCPTRDPAAHPSDWIRLAAQIGRLEHCLAEARGAFKPGKLALPTGGPWLQSVRTHLRWECPAELAALDGAVGRAAGSAREPPDRLYPALFPAAPFDAAHAHGLCPEALTAAEQAPGACDLGLPDLADWPSPSRSLAASSSPPPPIGAGPCPAPPWLATAFEDCVQSVRIQVRQEGGADGGLAPLRRTLHVLDGLDLGYPAQEQAEAARALDASLGPSPPKAVILSFGRGESPPSRSGPPLVVRPLEAGRLPAPGPAPAPPFAPPRQREGLRL